MLKGTNIQKLKEAEKNLKMKNEEVEHFLQKIKYVKVNDVLSSTTEKELIEAINNNVPQIKKIYNKTEFSLERIYKIINLFQKDLIKKLVEIFKEKKMLQMGAETYRNVILKNFMSQIKLKFETTSGTLLNFIKGEKLPFARRGRKLEMNQLLDKFNNRLEKISAFMETHEAYVKKYLSIYKYEDSDWRDWLQQVNFTKVEELTLAYNVINNTDVYDLTPQGVRSLDDIQKMYNSRIEKIFKQTIHVSRLNNYKSLQDFVKSPTSSEFA